MVRHGQWLDLPVSMYEFVKLNIQKRINRSIRDMQRSTSVKVGDLLRPLPNNEPPMLLSLLRILCCAADSALGSSIVVLSICDHQ